MSTPTLTSHILNCLKASEKEIVDAALERVHDKGYSVNTHDLEGCWDRVWKGAVHIDGMGLSAYWQAIKGIHIDIADGRDPYSLLRSLFGKIVPAFADDAKEHAFELMDKGNRREAAYLNVLWEEVFRELNANWPKNDAF
ncbi:MAG TPA: hypothetical protein VHD69_00815 [Candidatus Paceibacterota bacterium]|jgi:hypothetical protein|nr:hypothetical protein [Candidatus Paceibacterota bacterium]